MLVWRMAEPLTTSAGLLVAHFLADHGLGHLVGGELHHFYREFIERWRESPRDPDTHLPRNHDVEEASQHALRDAALILVTELAGRIEPEKSWLTRLAKDLPGGGVLAMEFTLFPNAKEPHRLWLNALRGAILGNKFHHLHRYLKTKEENLLQCFAHGDVCNTLGPSLAEALLEWTRFELAGMEEYPDFESLVRGGWPVLSSQKTTDTSRALVSKGLAAKGDSVGVSQPDNVTIAHAYCLFFREHLKRNAKVFRIVMADTLTAMRGKFDKIGNDLTGEFRGLRDKLDSLVAARCDLPAFAHWLTPQLGGINQLLAGVKSQLDIVAHSQRELADRQSEILVAVTTLRAELARGNNTVQQALSEVAAFISRFKNRFDYLLAGLPIRQFVLPDTPKRELDLLHAKHRAVDLIGRDSDLEALSKWIESPEPISARLLIGAGGAGKTRLAFELLLRVSSEFPEWQAGVVTGDMIHRFDATKQPADWTWCAPTLVVLDYAQTLARPLSKFLLALTHKRIDGLPQLRILLLERQSGNWFDDLLRQEDSDGPCAIRALFHPPQPVELTSVRDGDLRRTIFMQTLHKRASLAGKPPVPLTSDEDPALEAALKRGIFAQPLNLMLAALVASEIGILPALELSRLDLAGQLAEKELRRLRRFVRKPDNESQERVICHLAACATLEQGFTANELERAVQEELTALQINWDDGPGDLANVLKGALPGDQTLVSPIQPDFIGEALVMTTLAGAEGSGSDRMQNWCGTVERCFRRQPFATPATLLKIFQNFGQEPTFKEALLAAVDVLISTALADSKVELLLGIEYALPDYTVELRTRAVRVARCLNDRLTVAMQEGTEDLRYDRAHFADTLARRLTDTGHAQEALTYARESVTLLRALIQEKPHAFQPSLASSLSSLAIILGETGRFIEAIGSAEESVRLYRALASQEDGFNINLAGVLHNLANVLRKTGRRTYALSLMQESIALTQAEAQRQLGDFRLPLANGLNDLAGLFHQLGRHSEAMDCGKKATELFRDLAHHNPDAFRPVLATAQNNLASFLLQIGRNVDAVTTARDSVAIYRALVRGNREAFRSGLAMSITTLANCLLLINQREEALALADEAVVLYRALSNENADAFRPQLAGAVTTLADCLREVGRPEDGLAPAREVVELSRILARDYPDAYRITLASCLRNIAYRYRELDRWEEALTAAQESVELYRTLAPKNDEVFPSELVGSLADLAHIFTELRLRANAITSAKQAVEIAQAAAQHNPTWAIHPDLANALDELTVALDVTGRSEEALTPALKAAEIYFALAQTDQNAYEHRLAGALDTLGIVLSSLGRTDAVHASKKAVDIYRSLALRKPDSFQSHLARALQNLAARLCKFKLRVEGLAAAQEAVEIWRSLVTNSPNCLPEFARSLDDLADRLADIDRGLDACAAREEASELYRLLAQEDAVYFRPKLVDSLNRWVTQLVYAGRHQDALAPAQECMETCRACAVAKPDAFIRKLALSWGALGQIFSNLGRRQDAMAAAEQAVRALQDQFEKSPEPVVADMDLLLRSYLGAAQAAKSKPDMKLVLPVVEVLRRLRPELFVERTTSD